MIPRNAAPLATQSSRPSPDFAPVAIIADDDRVIRDDPTVWAMEFRDGLVLRFLPARTALEAETLLAASAGDPT